MPAPTPPSASALANAANAATAAHPLAVLEWLPLIAAAPHDFAGPLIDALCRAAASIEWRQTYSRDEIGADFLRTYGYTEIMGPTAELRSDRLRSGFLLLAPETHYPRHHHPAQELYVVLSGTAAWAQGAEPWADRPPGTVIHHASNEPHAMRTAAEPLLALYLWHGAGLEQAARLAPA
jgi:mannose-6-phosphate isomerase-like protein (cupin superfamily)